jgi:uncharacterized RDD family membrane protein YckC
MENTLHFETPENVRVRYEPAGLGTRFVAWFVDQFVLWIGMFVLLVALLVAGQSFEVLEALFEPDPASDYSRATLYFVGFMILVWGLGSFVYFGCCELFLRGQTIGKRASHIRVIKADGFQLDAGSIIVRNLFRVVDHLPPMWLFPAISRLNQRAGDMVAGTLVVFDAPTSFSTVRTALAARTAADAQFRFDYSKLKLISGIDFMAIESVLDRLPGLAPEERDRLLQVYTMQLAKKLAVDAPQRSEQQRFLEDLFAAELRRQDRSLA